MGSRLGRLGRFQLEALIQAAHTRRLFGEAVQWELVTDLYGALVAGLYWALQACMRALVVDLNGSRVATWPTLGARIGHAAGRARAGSGGAEAAFTRALGLTEDPAIRRFLLQRQRSGVA